MKSHAVRLSALRLLALTALITIGGSFPAASAATYTWDGGGGSNNWSDALNWVGDVVPLSSSDTELIFAGTTRLTPLQNSNFLLNTLDFAANAGAFTLSGTGTLEFQTGATNGLLPSIVQASAANQTINHALLLTNPIGIYALGAGTLTLNGVLSGAGSLTKQGAGTLTLTASNSYNGGTAIAAGTLRLDFSASGAPANNILATGSLFSMNGSTLALQGSNAAATNSSQTFGGLTLNSGANVISVTSGTGGSTTLTLGAITRNLGGLLNFVLPTSGAINTASGTASTILTSSGAAYATVGGNDWAAKDATNTRIVAGSTISGFYTNSTATTLSGNANVAAGVTTTTLSSAATTVTSLRFNQAQATTINVGGGHTLTAGGILVTSATGNNLTQITGGTLTGASGQDLVIIQNNTANGLSISSAIANNGAAATGLSKGGAGTLTLTGASTATGVARVAEGTLTFAAGSSWTNPGAQGNPAIGFAVRAGATLNISGSVDVTNNYFQLSTTVGSQATANLFAGGTLSTYQSQIGQGGTGTFNQTGGTHTTTALLLSTAFSASSVPISNGVYNLSGGILNADLLDVGQSAPGAFNHTDGTVNALGGGLLVSQGSTYTLSGANSRVNATTVILGANQSPTEPYFGPGTITQNGGTLTLTGDPNNFTGYLSVGDTTGGVYNLTGGALSTAETDVGYGGTGVFNQSGGTHTITNAGPLYLGFNGGSSGVYNLSGSGTLQAGSVSGGSGASTFNFNGGVLQAAASNTNFVSALNTANVQTGGAKIDTNGFDVTVSQPLVHDSALGATADGGLAKNGAGTLILTGANTYTGPTLVNAGTLLINGSIGTTATPAGAVSAAGSNIVLGGSGTIHANVGVSGGATLSPGATGSGSTATLNVGALTLGRNSTLLIELNNTTASSGYDQVSLTGTLTFGGSRLTVFSAPGLATGSVFYIVLNDGMDAISGNFTLGQQLPEGSTFADNGNTFQISYMANGDGGSAGNDISLTVVAVPEPATWLGGAAAVALLLGAGRRWRLRTA